MAKFKYKAINNKGERIEGVYVAESSEDVVAMISSNKYQPLLIEEVKYGINLDLKAFNNVKTKDIAIFCRQFGTMLEAGVSINGGIHILSKQIPNKKLKEVLVKVEYEVKKGEALSDSMRKQKGNFPDLLLSMIEVGEVSGTLDSVMDRMSTYYEKENKINSKIKNALVYPIILGIVALAVVVFILTFILPMFVNMFKSSGTELPMPTKIVLAMSSGVHQYGVFILAGIVAAVLALKNYFTKVEVGVLKFNKFKLKVPPFKSLNQKIIVSRFTRSLSTILSSGIPLIQALDIVAVVVGNKVAENEIIKVKSKVLQGDGLAEPIKESGIFPLMLSSMIKIGEESGALDSILNKTADFYDDELEAEIQVFTTMIEPIMIIIMGVVIGFLMIAILMPMFGMFNTIQ